MKRVSAGVLKNGFRFYTQYNSESHVSGIGVRAGSIYDPAGKNGLSHLAEHMLTGYSREEELKFEEYGCGPEESGINVRVDRASAFFGHNLLLRREYASELWKIIAGYLNKPRVTRGMLEMEQAAVLNEYFLRGEDKAEDVVETLMHGNMYERNPARNKVDCEPADLKNITCADMRQFVRTHYAPNNLFAIILNLPFQKVKRLCEEYFGDLKTSSDLPAISSRGETRPAFPASKYVEIERSGIHQYHVAIGFPTNPYGNKDDEALDVLAKIWAFRLRLAPRDAKRKGGEGAHQGFSVSPRASVDGIN